MQLLRAVAEKALGPVWQGVLLVACCYLVPLFDLFAMVVMGLITLRQGMLKGFVVAIGGTVLGVILGFVASSWMTDVNFELLTPSLLWALGLAIIYWLFAGLLRKTVSLSFTLQVMTAVFMVIFICSYSLEITIYPDYFRAPILELVNNNFVANLAKIQQDTNLDADFVLTPEVIKKISVFLVSVFEAISIYATNIMLLLMARAWQGRLFMPGEFNKEFRNLRSGLLINIAILSYWILIVLLPSSVLTYSLLGAVLVGVVWLFVIGVSLVHWSVNYFKLSLGILVLFYLLLVLPILSSMLMFGLITVGLIDGFYDLRALVAKSKS